MTRDEFHKVCVDLGWPQGRIDAWNHVVPTCDAETFRRETLRPDGIVEVRLIPRKEALALSGNT